MKKNSIYFFISLLLLFGCKDEQVVELNQWDLPTDEFNELLVLSDTSTIIDYPEFGERINRIQEIFAAHKDPRGTFTTIYKFTTLYGLEYINDELYEYPQFIIEFSIAFGKLYLVNLHEHLLNKPTSESWAIYYNLCRDSEHLSRLILSGINVHLTIDILDALIAAQVTPENEADWILANEALQKGVEGFQLQFENDYGIDISDLLSLYGLVDFFDGIYGEGATIYTVLKELRYKSYKDALNYRNGLENEMKYKTRKRYEDQENIIQQADKLGLLP